MERPLPSSKLILALMLLVLAPLLEARILGGPLEDRLLRSPAMMMLPSDRDGTDDDPAAKVDAAAPPGVGWSLGRAAPPPPPPQPNQPLHPGGDARPHAARYRRKRAPARRPADVLAVIRDAIVQYVVGA
ncbi:hypothetical protein ACP70R_039533 [Stipagrostis hirtigluma subsp. patula]